MSAVVDQLRDLIKNLSGSATATFQRLTSLNRRLLRFARRRPNKMNRNRGPVDPVLFRRLRRRGHPMLECYRLARIGRDTVGTWNERNPEKARANARRSMARRRAAIAIAKAALAEDPGFQDLLKRNVLGHA